MTVEIPPHLQYLLERPFFGSLGTVRPDGAPQVNPMWFEFIDGTVRFTHTTYRAKWRNLQLNPAMSFMVFDPDDPNDLHRGARHARSRRSPIPPVRSTCGCSSGTAARASGLRRMRWTASSS